MRFANRVEAGRQLAKAVQPLGLDQPVVLALPRGGVPVAAEVARALHAPLDLLLVRKIGAPWNPEFAIAAIAEGSEPVIDDESWRLTGATPEHLARETAAARAEIARRRQVYLAGRAAVPLAGRNVVVVDDGIATGATVRAALRSLRQQRPARLVLAVPVAPPDTVAALRAEVDDLVCLSEPVPFNAVGAHYVDFHQVGDAEVVALLAGT